MNEEPIQMDEPKQKLMRLEELIPNATGDLLYAFGRYLADCLNPQLVPMGFIMGCELAIADLETGVNGFTGESITGSLAGYPPMVYGLLRMNIPHIADVVFPAEFAEQVKAHIEEINATA